MTTYKTIEDAIGARRWCVWCAFPGADNERRGNVILGKLGATTGRLGEGPAGDQHDPARRGARRDPPGDTLIEATSATPASRSRWPRRSAATACCS